MSLMLLMLQAPVCLFAAADPVAEPVPVILDTDLGDDIDDTWALAMLLGCPQLDTRLIVTAWRDTEARARLAAKLLERLGRTDIPLGIGVKTGDGEMAQAQWIGDYALDAYPGTLHRDGVQAMIDTIKASPRPVTLIVIGPQTNIREALKRDPAIAENARVITMAGSVRIGYGGREGAAAEWNVRCDVEAVRAVFAAPWEVIMNPLDLCGQLQLQGDDYAKVTGSDHPRARAVIENYDIWKNRHRYPEDSTSVLFDTVSVYLAFDESLCRFETVKLSVTDEGVTVPDPNGRPVRCAIGWKDDDAEPAFKKLLIESLTSEKGARLPRR